MVRYRSSVQTYLVVESPAVNETKLHLAIVIELHNTTQLELGQTFNYRPDPIFTDIEPRSHLIM